MAVIDLTGTTKSDDFDEKLPIEPANDLANVAFSEVFKVAENYIRKAGPVLNFSIPDFSIPDWDKDIWIALVESIAALLDEGTDVLMACQGGHGRTGLTAAIVVYMLDKTVMEDMDPILWVRKQHCHKCVERYSQIDYIYAMLDLPVNKNVKPYSNTVISKVASTYKWDYGTFGSTHNDKGGDELKGTSHIVDELLVRLFPSLMRELTQGEDVQ